MHYWAAPRIFSQPDRRDAPLGLAELGRVDIMHRESTAKPERGVPIISYRFTTYQDARRVRLVDGIETNILQIFETNILRVSPVNPQLKKFFRGV